MTIEGTEHTETRTIQQVNSVASAISVVDVKLTQYWRWRPQAGE